MRYENIIAFKCLIQCVINNSCTCPCASHSGSYFHRYLVLPLIIVLEVQRFLFENAASRQVRFLVHLNIFFEKMCFDVC